MSHSITINDELYKELKEYCDLNNLKMSNLCGDLLKKGLNELKYGDIPFGIITKPTALPIKQELIPVQPMSFPKGEPLLTEMYKSDDEKIESRQESRQIVQIEENKEEFRQESRQVVPNEEKKDEAKTKHKRTRVLS